MVRHCFLANISIRLHAEFLREIGLDLGSLYLAVHECPETPLAHR